MNTTTHVFGAGGVVVSGRSGNTKCHDISKLASGWVKYDWLKIKIT